MTLRLPEQGLTKAEHGELINLYHLARVPLSDKRCTRYARMIWASGEFAKAHPEFSPTLAYKLLDRALIPPGEGGAP